MNVTLTNLSHYTRILVHSNAGLHQESLISVPTFQQIKRERERELLCVLIIRITKRLQSKQIGQNKMLFSNSPCGLIPTHPPPSHVELR